MNCTNCGAPLPPQTNRCSFCHTLNDVDLRAIPRGPDGGVEPSQRSCPRCDEELEIVPLNLADGFGIDRCRKCQGIFFDPGELESILDESVSKVYEVDYPRLAKLVEEEGIKEFREISYIKCPDCMQVMNRKAYGARSGVIVDQCRDHGVWLDGRELHVLLHWVKAGGQIHQKDREAREAIEEEQRRAKLAGPIDDRPIFTGSHRYERMIDASDLFRAVRSITDILF
ncbi:MAG TPA: zf-TFIIB domain-containing protein [Phycisphaerae bacterium]|nr:zf-TFIIB domain-containing protein [Phycisphaerae bacterium]